MHAKYNSKFSGSKGEQSVLNMAFSGKNMKLFRLENAANVIRHAVAVFVRIHQSSLYTDERLLTYLNSFLGSSTLLYW